MTVDSPVPSQASASRLRQAIGRMYRSFRHDRDSDLTTAQLSLLATVDRSGPVRLGDLAAHEGVQPSTLTRSIAWLTSKGLVTRSVPDDDRRASVVVISPAGKDLLDRSWHQRTARLAERIAMLSPADQAALNAALPALESLLADADND